MRLESILFPLHQMVAHSQAIEPCLEALKFRDWFLIRVNGGRRAYFHNDLVNPNNILKTCIALPEPFVQTVKIRHELEIVILLHVNTHCPWPTVKDKPEVYGEHWHLQRKFQQGFVVCLEQR